MRNMSKRALITGITGFVGSHLAELLLKKGYLVYGIARWRSRMDNIEHLLDDIILVQADLTDPHSIKDAIKKVNPDKIFHLAAQSYVPASWEMPVETMQVNVIGTVNLLEAVKEIYRYQFKDPIIHIAGSSEEYGLVKPNEIPIKETNPLRPLSPYGVSKVAEDLLGQQYHMSYALATVITRAFNHTGPRRGDVFVCSNFAKQIALIEKGKQKPIIYHGNLEAKRDFTDVRDMVEAYYLATEKCEYGTPYNVCSEKAYSIREILEILLSMANKKIKLVVDEDRMRPSDVPLLLGDCSKFRKTTGWSPKIPIEKTLIDLLNYWRERI